MPSAKKQAVQSLNGISPVAVVSMEDADQRTPHAAAAVTQAPDGPSAHDDRWEFAAGRCNSSKRSLSMALAAGGKAADVLVDKNNNCR
jgi:hypothetical protein